MELEERVVAEAVCACGCGEPTTIYRGAPRRYVYGHNRRKGPRPAERVCARPGCENLHRHELYCSQACHFEDHRVDDGTCPTCGRTFPRTASAVARGKGRYCSIACRKTGELVGCLECGAETYRLRSELERGYRFCSWSCWMVYRWREDSDELRLRLADAMRHRWHTGLGLESLIDLQGADARRRYKGRWRGREAGRLGGKERGYDAEKVRQVRGLRRLDPNIGRRRIARLVELSEKQVRGILTELEG